MSDRGAYGKVSGTMTPDDVVASVCRLADDFKTQPTGHAGDRVACGVIGYAKQ